MEKLVSIIIPVYNEEKRIGDCLKSILSQNFDLKKIEVLIVDDDSSDKTLEIVKKFPVKILRNGKKDYDLGKAIGIRNSHGKYLLFIDADNRLKDKNWLKKAVSILDKKKNVIGVQSWKFSYSKDYNLGLRYQGLFGGVDPVVFYFKNQDHLPYYEDKWIFQGKVIENEKDYLIIHFKPEEIPTLGSQGFLTRKSYFKKIECFQHIEFLINMAKKENSSFGFLKNEVVHLGFNGFKDILKKLSRNMDHFLKDSKKEKQERYSLGLFKITKTFLVMISLIIPIINSIRGFRKIKDYAWFLHIVLCFIIPFIYSYKVLKNKLK